MITVEIPENTEKLKQIIAALERQIKVDSREKDKRIHQAALDSLRASLIEREGNS
mgnify:FL=1